LLENKPLPSHISGEEGWKDMKVIDAIYEAAARGKKIML
jgi:predicted dehydrogenase